MTISLMTHTILRHMHPLRAPYHRIRSPSGWGRSIHLGSSATIGKITINGIEKELKRPVNPLYVPQKFGEFANMLVLFG